MADRTCSVPDCERPTKARGWCPKHYGRWQRYGGPDLPARPDLTEQRFWEKVDRRGPDECWPWTASRYPAGYGMFGRTGRSPIQASRMAYMLTLPDEDLTGLSVRHTCDNPPCCNPAHLLSGTNDDNIRDKVERNRSGKGTLHWNASLTEADVRAIRADPRRRFAEIAADYGTTASNIQRIRARNSWKHIE